MVRTALAASLLAAATVTFAQPVAHPFPAYEGEAGGRVETVSVAVSGAAPGARRFTLSSTAEQRDAAPNTREIVERPDAPWVVSGSPLFDALFAQAVDDARLDSVENIQDGAYNAGRPIPCACFQTGEKWTYVWTRDLAYAVDLGLADLDPRRSVTSLLFKTSGFRAGIAVPAALPAGSTQIVQDTGSGGSWPVSTDRVAWALGAEATLANLHGAERDAFAKKAYSALRGTVEADREAAFDAHDGLYGGEHSFLDWREQTYAPWIVDDLAWMAQSKALSTNVLQYRALRLAARLARDLGEPPVAERYDGWAQSLRTAIDARFWVPDAGLYATMSTADVHSTPVRKFDLLGNALAVVSGIAGPERARELVARYPHAPFGPPVYWPQQPGGFVYHNRAQWPFVTAYGLRAAAAVDNAAAADRAVAALMRAAALNLSNMENLEWLTGKARFDDGPAINSRRQLWSVGAYLGMVTETLFGWHVGPDGVRIAPYLTTAARALLGSPDRARLGGLSFHGRPVSVELRLPAAAPAGGTYPVAAVTLNGRAVKGPITRGQLKDHTNEVVVTFGAPRPTGARVTTIASGVPALSHDDARVFAPPTPSIARVVHERGRVSLEVAMTATSRPLRHDVYRDGRPVGTTDGATWTDTKAAPRAFTTCYTVVALDTTTGLASHPSPRACLRGEWAQEIPVTDPRVKATSPVTPAGGGVAVPTVAVGLGQTMRVADVALPSRGDYAIRFDYDNHVFALNTGVTNAVKRLVVTDSAGQRHERVVQMPHVRPVDGGHPIRSSTFARLTLPPGPIHLELSDFFNMSALASNATYKEPGGATGPVNEAHVAAIRIDAIDPGYPSNR